MQKHSITLCMIVKDEEKYLDRCLRSVKGKVDEIIVVDTGSADSTVEIAKKHNADIQHFEWIDDFAAARNYSIRGVKTDYILVLDADEYLDEKADLQQLLESGKDCYRLLLKNYQIAGNSVIHQSIRLFRSGIGLMYKGKLHEHLNTFEEGSGYSEADSDIIIHHVGYLPEVISDKNKSKRNLDIMARELRENPTGYSYFNMGMAYMNDGKYEKALDMFKKSYPLSKDKTYVRGMLVHMGECLALLKRAEEGINLMTDAINVFPDYTDLHYTLGVLFQNIGYLRDAEAEFKECLRLGDDKLRNIAKEGVGSYLASYQLASIHEKKGKHGEAFDEVFESVKGNKKFHPALTLYLKLMKRSGVSLEDMRKHLDIVYPVDTPQELNILIAGLYKVRHPLISRYDFVYRQENLTNLRAVAYMLGGDYGKAVEEWGKIERIPRENFQDVLVLMLMANDMSLAEKLGEGLNLSEKEWKYLVKIIGRSEISKSHITADIERLLMDAAYYLLDIEAFDQFEYISRFLLECSVDTQNKVAALLIDRGQLNTASELLSLNLERHPENYEVYLLAGDVFSINNDFTAALEFYEKSLRLKRDYPVYEKIYEIYEKLGDNSNMRAWREKIRSRFPLVRWVNNC